MTMDPAILVCTLACEIGLLAGYLFAWMLDESDLDGIEARLTGKLR